MIVYAVVARGDQVLAEFSHSEVRIQETTVVRTVLQRINDEHKRNTFKYDDRHFFHCIVQDGICFLCQTGQEDAPRVVFHFLENISTQFMERYSHVAKEAHAFELNTEFSPLLQETMEYYNLHPADASRDKLDVVTKKVEQTKEVMLENIDKILERGEKIDLLVEKSEELNESAFTFQRSAKELKKTMLCKRIKTAICAFIVFLICVLFLSIVFCGGFAFKNCKNDDDDK